MGDEKPSNLLIWHFPCFLGALEQGQYFHVYLKDFDVSEESGMDFYIWLFGEQCYLFFFFPFYYCSGDNSSIFRSDILPELDAIFCLMRNPAKNRVRLRSRVASSRFSRLVSLSKVLS